MSQYTIKLRNDSCSTATVELTIDGIDAGLYMLPSKGSLTITEPDVEEVEYDNKFIFREVYGGEFMKTKRPARTEDHIGLIRATFLKESSHRFSHSLPDRSEAVTISLRLISNTNPHVSPVLGNPTPPYYSNCAQSFNPFAIS